MFQEDLALFSLTHDYGRDVALPSQYRAEAPHPDFTGAMELRRRRAATGPEMTRAHKLVYHYHQAKQAKSWLKMVVRRLLGERAAVNNPYERRIWAVFESLKAEAQKTYVTRSRKSDHSKGPHQIATDVQEDLQVPSASPSAKQSSSDKVYNSQGLTWGSAASAALCACTYACFKESDDTQHTRDPLQRRAFSLHLVASCCDVTHAQARKWAKRLKRFLPGRFATLVFDTPEMHVDQVVQWLGEQAASSTPSPLLDVKHNLPILRNRLVDWKEVRRLSRLLCSLVFDSSEEEGRNDPRDKMVACGLLSTPGDWAYMVVLWAIGALLGKRLMGKQWVRRDLIWASLGVEPAKPRAKDDEDSGASEDDGEDNAPAQFDASSSNAPNWPFISLYHDIGIYLSCKALQLPWVDAHSIKRTKGGRDVLKDGEEVKYLRDVVEFSASLRGGDDQGQQAPTLSKRAQKANKAASPSLPIAMPPQFPTFATIPSDRPSYTARNFPQLSADPALIDSLDPATVDALLFRPGEMDGFLRSEEGDRRKLEGYKRTVGHWESDEENESAAEQDDGQAKKKRKKVSGTGQAAGWEEQGAERAQTPSRTSQGGDEENGEEEEEDDEDAEVLSLHSEHYR